MSRKKNLNSESSDYIESNILKESPEGLPPLQGTIPKEAEVVIANSIPQTRKVKFINGRDPGYPLDFHYHSKTHPLKHYVLYHGTDYELPVEIIEHLENCCEAQYGYRTGPNGHPEMFYKPAKYLYRCQSVKQAA